MSRRSGIWARYPHSPSLRSPSGILRELTFSTECMSPQRANSTEKSPVEEKGSVDIHDSGSSQGGDDQSPALGYTTPKMARKPTLPYAWQMVMIVLTCLCTCAYARPLDLLLWLTSRYLQSETTGRMYVHCGGIFCVLGLTYPSSSGSHCVSAWCRQSCQ